jgi:hypothetical protein
MIRCFTMAGGRHDELQPAPQIGTFRNLATGCMIRTYDCDLYGTLVDWVPAPFDLRSPVPRNSKADAT